MIKNILLLLWVVFAPIFSTSLLAQKFKPDSCHAYIDSIFLPEATIIDSTLYHILDSALVLIDTVPRYGYNNPYYFELYPTIDTQSTLRRLTVLANNWFVTKHNLKDAEEGVYRNSILVSHKGVQILISRFLVETYLQNYIKIGDSKKPYYIYSFFKGEREVWCTPSQLYKQYATFFLWPGRQKPFSFEQYTYLIDDMSFIFDNELVEEPKKKKR